MIKGLIKEEAVSGIGNSLFFDMAKQGFRRGRLIRMLRASMITMEDISSATQTPH